MSDEQKQPTKAEILSEMRELQQQYSAKATLLKQMQFDEEMKERETRQLERLETYRAKYKYYVQPDGSTKEIDWEEVEKLIKVTVAQDPAKGGFALGFDQTGMEGLGHESGNSSAFTPMVEEESDARKYVEREERRQKFVARQKETKR